MKFSKKNISYGGVCLVLLVLVCVAVGIKNKTTYTIAMNKKLPIYSVGTEEKKVAISFDASWGADNTQNLIDVLDKYKVKSTFFLVGGWVDKYPDKVKLIHERGHEIGNHSNSHADMTKLSKEKIIQEVAATDAKIMTITDEKTKLFRFPSGAYDNKAIEAIESTGHKCIQWDVDSLDWKEKGAKAEYDRVVANVKPGSIILFHNNAKYTPENLPKIIEKLQADGYKIVPVSELIYQDNYELDHNGKQVSKEIEKKKTNDVSKEVEDKKEKDKIEEKNIE
ncbi:polysaccharide deacetylase family sporulation protein PdaB [Hathewaya proteolytica DSM 3090]|uniref:Polysaccharide deacetylase family sporulation protein PdaB n=1 Tax=Hathewaya proteolytica DSM 3090 TaxID=1121331 RepID=A0A1M6SFQ9_9CLOT|nr:polysaccharide deacetylase family sporulation protein PdaB [Hathewaya proteolytica]SHK43614.1 polysaccharide deacetylase family sporulation protein PdaB [Hathewaya proteolytica DSM 3090]